MAKLASILDKYIQRAVLRVNGAAATNGNVVNQLITGITNLQKIAWLVGRIDYEIPGTWVGAAVMTAQANYAVAGLSQSGNVDQLPTPDNASLVDHVRWGGRTVNTSVGVEPLLVNPWTHEFGPDDGILVLPQTLFAFLFWSTTGNLSAIPLFLTVWYREVELGPEDWYDLLQLRLPLGAS